MSKTNIEKMEFPLGAWTLAAKILDALLKELEGSERIFGYMLFYHHARIRLNAGDLNNIYVSICEDMAIFQRMGKK